MKDMWLSNRIIIASEIEREKLKLKVKVWCSRNTSKLELLTFHHFLYTSIYISGCFKLLLGFILEETLYFLLHFVHLIVDYLLSVTLLIKT